MNKLHWGTNCMDCLEGLKLMKDNSINLVVTSPPYDNLREYKEGHEFDFEGIAKELYRVIKEGGVVVWNVNDATIKGDETGSSFHQVLFFKEIGFNLHDTMIWIKDGDGDFKCNFNDNFPQDKIDINRSTYNLYKSYTEPERIYDAG